MANQLETAALNALSELLCATSQYGFNTPQVDEFWENKADSAMEEGQTSDDIRRAVWERAYRALTAVTN